MLASTRSQNNESLTVGPNRVNQVDDEEVVRVQHEADTTDQVQLDVALCDDGLVGVCALVFLL